MKEIKLLERLIRYAEKESGAGRQTGTLKAIQHQAELLLVRLLLEENARLAHTGRQSLEELHRSVAADPS